MEKNYKIALIIGIILLLIILGIVLFTNVNSIIKSKTNINQFSESDAKTQVQNALNIAKSNKESDASYNSEDYLTSLLRNNNLTVSRKYCLCWWI